MTLTFVKGGSARPFCITGWSEPEQNETWSIGKASVLDMPVTVTDRAIVLMLVIRPHVNDNGLRSQRLGVLANGVRIADFTVDSRTTRACVVPFSVLEGKPSLRLVFETPDAAAPRLFGQGDDDRSLAIAFTRLVLWPEAPGSDISEMEDNPAGDRVLNVDDVLEADRVPVSKLMLQFESLGQNCEFGLVQRHFKAEPLGIFRFSSTPLPQLLLALERRLEGLGEAGSVMVDISPNGQELMVKDKTFGFLYHAWVRTGEQTVEAVEQRECRRLPFLKRKLLDDLILGEKVFVFHAMRRIPEQEVFPLAAILRCFGPTTLLFVTLADEQHAVGTVELRAPGFMVGYLDRFAPANDAHAASYAAWANLCRQAYRLFRAGV